MRILSIKMKLSFLGTSIDDLKSPRRIDTHHHIVPEFYAKAVEQTGGDPSGWPTPKWSIQQAIEHMSKH